VIIEQVPAATVRPLRQRVLRPHQTIAEQVFDGDDAPGAAHFAAFASEGDDQPMGIASITPEPHPVSPAPGDWRIRGMATDPERGRGTGAGARLLTACIDHARAHRGARVWCNARTPAAGFYVRAGFATEGEEFTMPSIGPHFLMSLVL
jgi:predicted GNAT family N-acyltransferase